MSEPTLAELLRTLADEEAFDRTAARLGMSPSRIAERLREGARAVDFSPPPLRRAPEPVARAAEPAPVPGEAKNLPKLVLFSDGAARGNPGPAGAGAVLKTPDGRIVARVGKFLGVQTNNYAEYLGLILGAERALELGARELDVRADSLLVVSQLRGEWKVKHPGIVPLHARAKALLQRFGRVSIQHVRRELNGDADEMSNRAIDERM